MRSKVSMMLTRNRQLEFDRAVSSSGLDHESLTGRSSAHDWALNPI